MDAHEYIGQDDLCEECERPPGNYIHIGISDAEKEARGWPERKAQARDLNLLLDTPAVLRETQ